MNGGPNPRVQRTRPASLRSPLTRHPLRAPGAVILLGASLIVACASRPPGTSGSVAGRAVDERGTRLPGVTVLLEPEAGSGTRVEVTTADGSYVFKKVSPGRYRLGAQFAGYLAPPQREITVSPSIVIVKELVMRVDPAAVNGVIGPPGDPQIDVVRRTPVPR